MAFSETGGRPHFALSPLAWCGRRDLNPHDFRHGNLNPARLPIPPRPRGAVTGQSCAAIPAGLNAAMAAKARLKRGPPVDLVYLAAGVARIEDRKETHAEPNRKITIRAQKGWAQLPPCPKLLSRTAFDRRGAASREGPRRSGLVQTRVRLHRVAKPRRRPPQRVPFPVPAGRPQILPGR